MTKRRALPALTGRPQGFSAGSLKGRGWRDGVGLRNRPFRPPPLPPRLAEALDHGKKVAVNKGEAKGRRGGGASLERRRLLWLRLRQAGRWGIGFEDCPKSPRAFSRPRQFLTWR